MGARQEQVGEGVQVGAVPELARVLRGALPHAQVQRGHALQVARIRVRKQQRVVRVRVRAQPCAPMLQTACRKMCLKPQTSNNFATTGALQQGKLVSQLTNKAPNMICALHHDHLVEDMTQHLSA